MEKQKFFKVREKSGKFAKGRKISVLVKVSEKSGNFVFRFCDVYEDIFIRKMKPLSKMELLVKSNAMRSKSHEKHKEIENEEKNIDGLQKKLKLM